MIDYPDITIHLITSLVHTIPIDLYCLNCNGRHTQQHAEQVLHQAVHICGYAAGFFLNIVQHMRVHHQVLIIYVSEGAKGTK